MSNPILNPTAVCQVAIVVRDLEQVAKNYAAVFGLPVPPVIETGPASKTQIAYRGATTPGRAKLAFFNLGAVTLELIEPIDGASTWREVLDKNGPGLHHVAFKVPHARQTVQALEQLGATTVQTGDFHGGNYSYVDATQPLGTILELLEFDTP